MEHAGRTPPPEKQHLDAPIVIAIAIAVAVDLQPPD
jgi:hypothetical protein